MIERFKTLFSGQFVRSVSKLSLATGFSQAVMLFALPVLTRLYSPEEYGLLSIVTAFLAVLGAISSLRYQVAIPLPKTDIMAANVMAVGILSTVIITVLSAILLFLFSEPLLAWLDAPRLQPYLWFIPAGVLVIGLYNNFQFWSTRKKAFGSIARTRVEQSVGSVFTQVVMGWYGFGVLGLLCGMLINQGAGFIGLMRRAIRNDSGALRAVRARRMLAAARAYDHYPKFSTLEALANSASVQLPLLLIVSFAGSVELGLLVLAIRIMQAPMSLVGVAVSQVYYVQAVEADREGRLPEFTIKVIAWLAKLGIGPMIFAGIISPVVFGYIFGSDWGRTGVLLSWMVPWFVFQFLSSPVSMALHVRSNQRLASVLQISGFVIRLVSVSIAGVFLTGYVSEVYAVSSAVFYAVYMIVVCHVVGIGAAAYLRIILQSLPIVLIWALLGGGLHLIMV